MVLPSTARLEDPCPFSTTDRNWSALDGNTLRDLKDHPRPIQEKSWFYVKFSKQNRGLPLPHIPKWKPFFIEIEVKFEPQWEIEMRISKYDRNGKGDRLEAQLWLCEFEEITITKKSLPQEEAMHFPIIKPKPRGSRLYKTSTKHKAKKATPSPIEEKEDPEPVVSEYRWGHLIFTLLVKQGAEDFYGEFCCKSAIERDAWVRWFQDLLVLREINHIESEIDAPLVIPDPPSEQDIDNYVKNFTEDTHKDPGRYSTKTSNTSRACCWMSKNRPPNEGEVGWAKEEIVNISSTTGCAHEKEGRKDSKSGSDCSESTPKLKTKSVATEAANAATPKEREEGDPADESCQANNLNKRRQIKASEKADHILVFGKSMWGLRQVDKIELDLKEFSLTSDFQRITLEPKSAKGSRYILSTTYDHLNEWMRWLQFIKVQSDVKAAVEGKTKWQKATATIGRGRIRGGESRYPCYFNREDQRIAFLDFPGFEWEPDTDDYGRRVYRNPHGSIRCRDERGQVKGKEVYMVYDLYEEFFEHRLQVKQNQPEKSRPSGWALLRQAHTATRAFRSNFNHKSEPIEIPPHLLKGDHDPFSLSSLIRNALTLPSDVRTEAKRKGDGMVIVFMSPKPEFATAAADKFKTQLADANSPLHRALNPRGQKRMTISYDLEPKQYDYVFTFPAPWEDMCEATPEIVVDPPESPLSAGSKKDRPVFDEAAVTSSKLDLTMMEESVRDSLLGDTMAPSWERRPSGDSVHLGESRRVSVDIRSQADSRRPSNDTARLECTSPCSFPVYTNISFSPPKPKESLQTRFARAMLKGLKNGALERAVATIPDEEGEEKAEESKEDEMPSVEQEEAANEVDASPSLPSDEGKENPDLQSTTRSEGVLSLADTWLRQSPSPSAPPKRESPSPVMNVGAVYRNGTAKPVVVPVGTQPEGPPPLPPPPLPVPPEPPRSPSPPATACAEDNASESSGSLLSPQRVLEDLSSVLKSGVGHFDDTPDNNGEWGEKDDPAAGEENESSEATPHTVSLTAPPPTATPVLPKKPFYSIPTFKSLEIQPPKSPVLSGSTTPRLGMPGASLAGWCFCRRIDSSQLHFKRRFCTVTDKPSPVLRICKDDSQFDPVVTATIPMGPGTRISNVSDLGFYVMTGDATWEIQLLKHVDVSQWIQALKGDAPCTPSNKEPPVRSPLLLSTEREGGLLLRGKGLDLEGEQRKSDFPRLMSLGSGSLLGTPTTISREETAFPSTPGLPRRGFSDTMVSLSVPGLRMQSTASHPRVSLGSPTTPHNPPKAADPPSTPSRPPGPGGRPFPGSNARSTSMVSSPFSTPSSGTFTTPLHEPSRAVPLPGRTEDSSSGKQPSSVLSPPLSAALLSRLHSTSLRSNLLGQTVESLDTPFAHRLAAPAPPPQLGDPSEIRSGGAAP